MIGHCRADITFAAVRNGIEGGMRENKLYMSVILPSHNKDTKG